MKPAAKPAAKKPIQRAAPPKAQLQVVKNDRKPGPGKVQQSATKVKPVSVTKSPVKPTEKAVAKQEAKKPAKVAAASDEVVKKKPGRPPKAQGPDDGGKPAGAKRGRKPKQDESAKPEDVDLGDLEDDLEGEPVPEVAAATEKLS